MKLEIEVLNSRNKNINPIEEIPVRVTPRTQQTNITTLETFMNQYLIDTTAQDCHTIITPFQFLYHANTNNYHLKKWKATNFRK